MITKFKIYEDLICEYQSWDHKNVDEVFGKIRHDKYNNGFNIVIGGGLKKVIYYNPFFDSGNISDVKTELLDVEEFYNNEPNRCIKIVRILQIKINIISDDSNIVGNMKIKPKLIKILKLWFSKVPDIELRLEAEKYNL